MESRFRQRLALAGLFFIALFVVSSFITTSPPSTHASAAKVVNFYHKHKNTEQVTSYLIELAVFVGVIFYWHLRELLCTVVSNRRLATAGFAGVILFAATGGLNAGINWSLADAVDHVSPDTMQTLNVLQNDLTPFLAGVGAAIFLACTGYLVVRSGVLPKWLGWVGLVLALVSLVIPFLGITGAALWTLITSIVLLATKPTSASLQADPPLPPLPAV